MNSHSNDEHPDFEAHFGGTRAKARIAADKEHRMEALKQRAEAMVAKGESTITAGKPGEEPLARWQSNGMLCRRMPDDPQGVLRISIGGGDLMDGGGYLVLRGDPRECRRLLQRALRALR